MIFTGLFFGNRAPPSDWHETKNHLVGYGRLGSFVGHFLKRNFSVGVLEINTSLRLEKGIYRLSLEEAMKRKIIILAVPIGSFKSLLTTIAPFLQPKTLVIDVCSVKDLPIQWMKKILPAHAYILGTHPLFGPDSIGEPLDGKPIVLCPERIPASQFRKIVQALRTTGMDTIIMNPRDHDRLMAETLFLTQFVGRGIFKLLPQDNIISTENYSLLRHIASASMNDSIQLFHEMYRYNHFSRRMPDKIIRQFRNLASTLPGR